MCFIFLFKKTSTYITYEHIHINICDFVHINYTANGHNNKKY